jgi:hypothetical protein
MYNITLVKANSHLATCFGYGGHSRAQHNVHKERECTTVNAILLKIEISVFVTSVIFICYKIQHGSRDGVVGIATRYGLEGPGGAIFSAPIQTGSRARLASCTMSTGSFPGVKAAGA